MTRYEQYRSDAYLWVAVAFATHIADRFSNSRHEWPSQRYLNRM